MKTLFRILIIATCIGIIYYYSNVEPSKTELLEGPSQISQPVSTVEQRQQNQMNIPRPTMGISKYIGKPTGEILDNYGKPNRIEPAQFGYEWWVYSSYDELLMVGVVDEIVTQIYANTMNNNVAPYKIGQSLDDIYRMTIFEQEVTVEIDDNIYIFAMSEMDMKNRILVKYEDIYAQLYIDGENKRLDGVRFMDGKTLVLQKPYELQFIGKLLEANTPSSYEQLAINSANGQQLTDLANSYRLKNELPVLFQSTQLRLLAEEHSENMLLENMASQKLEATRPLEDRMQEIELDYKQIGENIATNYKDSIEVMHGWINSKEHRALLLDEQFTHIGSGTFVNNFTQIYLQQ